MTLFQISEILILKGWERCILEIAVFSYYTTNNWNMTLFQGAHKHKRFEAENVVFWKLVYSAAIK